MNDIFAYVLLGFIVFQQLFFMRHIQRLVDKVMSRDYRDYVKATEVEQPKIVVPEYQPQEDLGTLTGFGA